jgi:hypothetical protein
MLKRMFATLVLYSGLATSVLAAEFTWFTDVQGREGWIEFAAETVSFQNRIHVFPRIGAPRIEGRSDGVVVTFEIDSNAPAGAAGFTQSVLSKVVTDPSRVSRNYQVNVPRPRGLRIKILRDGTELAGRQIDGQIPGRYTLQIKVPVSGTERETMLRGEFQVEASFDLPTANFSSLAVNVKESLVTHYKIEAFKSVVKSARTSGGKFLFFDWRRRSARTIINQSINEQRSTNVSRQTNVLTIDPNEAMIARVEQLLGISSLSKEAFVARHLAAAEKARTAGDFSLAALHEEYALKADDPTPKVQTELLEKALTALSGSEPAIAAFLANGIQFSETSGSSSSRFHGFGQTNTSYFGSNGYAEMQLTTALVRYVVNAGPFAAATPNEQAATRGLLKAVQNNDVAMVRAALRLGAAYNAVFGLQETTPLIMASQRCNSDIARALLQAGANPFLRDGNQKPAKKYARLAGCENVAVLIESFE